MLGWLLGSGGLGQAADVPPEAVERVSALAPVVSYANWPQALSLYAMPTVNRAMVEADVATLTEVRSCRPVRIADEEWPECSWSWTTPRDTAGRTSWLEVVATLTPNGRAASEYLLLRLADSTLPTPELLEQYQRAERPGALGAVAFAIDRKRSSEAQVRFQRGNLVLGVRGHGHLRTAALPTAFAVDREVVAGNEVSPEALVVGARRLLQADSAAVNVGLPHE
jgi:hypothetical protein